MDFVCPLGLGGIRIPPERLIAIANGSRGGWYSSVAQRFIDARSLFSAGELDYWTRRTVPQREQDYKQAVMSPFDNEIVERAARAFELSDYQVLHPSMLFRVRSRLQKDRALERMQDVLQHERFEISTRSGLHGLPPSYVAMSVAFTETLPDTDENRRFLSALVEHVATDADLVIVDCPPPGDLPLPDSDRVHLLQAIHPDTDASLQTEAVARARAFVGSHGGLAVVAAFCGTPALTYHSDRVPVDQIERLEAAAAHAGWGHVTVQRTASVQAGSPAAAGTRRAGRTLIDTARHANSLRDHASRFPEELRVDTRPAGRAWPHGSSRHRPQLDGWSGRWDADRGATAGRVPRRLQRRNDSCVEGRSLVHAVERRSRGAELSAVSSLPRLSTRRSCASAAANRHRRRSCRWAGCPSCDHVQGISALSQVLRRVERANPYRREVDAAFDRLRPDVLLVTPLLLLGRVRLITSRAAPERDRSVLAVGSWDHLTTKGLIHELPDRIVNQSLRGQVIPAADRSTLRIPRARAARWRNQPDATRSTAAVSPAGRLV